MHEKKYSEDELTAILAASLPVRASSSSSSSLMGEPAAMHLVRYVNRRTAPTEMSAAIAVAREHLGDMGTTVTLGDSLEWRYGSGTSRGVIADELARRLEYATPVTP